ncbi:MAG: AsnC family transcriptional regulator [Pseudomonadota bacterium]
MGIMDSTDRRLIAATQAGLPLSIRPYHVLAHQLGLSAKEVMQRIEQMIALGIIRRMGVVPNHYALGYTANGMSVWDMPDGEVRQAGMEVGGLDFVSHCYQRPRHPPLWPYNLFAMVHGRSRDEVQDKVERIAGMLGDRQRGHSVLYSTRILKKTGLRITQELATEKNV